MLETNAINAGNYKDSISTNNSATMNEHGENDSLSYYFMLNHLESNKDTHKEYLLVVYDKCDKDNINL